MLTGLSVNKKEAQTTYLKSEVKIKAEKRNKEDILIYHCDRMSKRKEFFRTNSSSHMLPKVSTLAELSLYIQQNINLFEIRTESNLSLCLALWSILSFKN